MPNYKGHVLGGAITYVAMVYSLPHMQASFLWYMCAFGICIFGALFPDIDVKSKGQKFFYIGIAFLLLLFLYGKRMDLFIACSLLSLLPLFVKHRGLFHHLWFLTLVSLTIGLMLGNYFSSHEQLIMWYAYFFLAGTWSHVILDRSFSAVKYWLKR